MTATSFLDGRVTLHCGDCLQCRFFPVQKIGFVFEDMLSASHRLQIVNSIIRGVSVPVMNNHSIWNRTMFALPIEDGAFFPRRWVRYFYPCSWVAILIGTNCNSANRHPRWRYFTRFEFCVRRKMNAFKTFVPWIMPFCKSICRFLPRTPFISKLVIVWHRSGHHTPFSSATSGTETRSLGPIRLDEKRGGTNFTAFCNHLTIISNAGARSIGIAGPLFGSVA